MICAATSSSLRRRLRLFSAKSGWGIDGGGAFTSDHLPPSAGEAEAPFVSFSGEPTAEDSEESTGATFGSSLKAGGDGGGDDGGGTASGHSSPAVGGTEAPGVSFACSPTEVGGTGVAGASLSCFFEGGTGAARHASTAILLKCCVFAWLSFEFLVFIWNCSVPFLTAPAPPGAGVRTAS